MGNWDMGIPIYKNEGYIMYYSRFTNEGVVGT